MEVCKMFRIEVSFLLILELYLTLALKLPQLQNRNAILVSENVQLDYTPIQRRRRSLSDGHPDEIHTKFTTDGGDLNLKFERTKWRQNLTPIHFYHLGLQHGSIEDPKSESCISIYTDLETRATALVDFCEMFGPTPPMLIELSINNTQHIIMTDPVGQTEEMTHKLYRVEEPESWTYKDYVPLDAEGSKGPSSAADANKKVDVSDVKRQRRADLSTPHTVELLLVIDFSLYTFWYNQTSGTNRRQQAEDNIRSFYPWIVHAMDLRYQGLTTTGLNIRVELVGILVMTTPEDSPWIEYNIDSQTVSQGDRVSFNGQAALQDFDTWMANRKAADSNFPKYDHAQLLTARDLQIDGNTGAAGFANLDAICTGKSQSVAEDHFNFLSITILTHELGHSLGAVHDGEGNSCSGTDMFIMAAINGAQTGDNARNPWEFSVCSANAIKERLTQLNISGATANCLITKNNTSLITETGELPGQRYNPDDQCKLIRGTGSFMCKTLHKSDSFASICTGMWCAVNNNTNNCTLTIPADGTTCGDKKWCIDGQCVSSADAPAADETCMFGDQLGVISRGSTCSDMVNSDLGNCYGNDIKTLCCETCQSHKTDIEGCEYGDHADCSLVNAASAYVCYNTSISSSDCCQTCATLRKTYLPASCAYGDSTINCRATEANCAANPDLCCETCKDVTSTSSTTTTARTTTLSDAAKTPDWVVPVAAGGGGALLLIIIVIGVIIYCRNANARPKPTQLRHRHGNHHRRGNNDRNKPHSYERYNGTNPYNKPGNNYHGGYRSRY